MLELTFTQWLIVGVLAFVVLLLFILWKPGGIPLWQHTSDAFFGIVRRTRRETVLAAVQVLVLVTGAILIISIPLGILGGGYGGTTIAEAGDIWLWLIGASTAGFNWMLELIRSLRGGT